MSLQYPDLAGLTEIAVRLLDSARAENSIFPAATSTTSAFFPGSGGETVGVFETYDGGDTVSYSDGVGQETHSALLLAAGSNDDSTIVVGGVFGAGMSSDNGATWSKVGWM